MPAQVSPSAQTAEVSTLPESLFDLVRALARAAALQDFATRCTAARGEV